jgi:hypothetical protein
MTDRDQDSRIDVAYIQAHWEALAAVAWAGKLAQGAGVVVIDRRGSRVPEIRYADQATLIAQGIDQAVPDLLEHLIEYDPVVEVIFVVLRKRRTLGYRLRAQEIPPPVAFERSQRLPRPPTA